MRKTKILSIITITLLLSSIITVIPANAVSEEDIEASIVAGLAWLAAQQNADGSWGGFEQVATTGLAVLKFIDRAKELEKNPFQENPLESDYYEYSVQVNLGLAYLFMHASTTLIGPQPAGNPDTDLDSLGVVFIDPGNIHHSGYATGISLMAVSSAAMYDPVRLVAIGPLNGWTYMDVVTDTAD